MRTLWNIYTKALIGVILAVLIGAGGVNYYTKTQSDAKYYAKTQADTTFVKVADLVTPTEFDTLNITTKATVPTLAVGANSTDAVNALWVQNELRKMFGVDSMYFNTSDSSLHYQYGGYDHKILKESSVVPNWSGLRTSAVFGLELDEASGTAFTGSFNSNDGTGSGTITSGVSGKINKAVTFTNGKITTPTSTDFDCNTISFNVWVKPSSLAATSNIIDRHTSGFSHTFNVAINTNGSIYVSHDSLSVASYSTTAGDITTGNYAMITFTYDGSNSKVYKNGNLIKTVACTGEIGISNQAVTIGVLGFGGYDPFVGDIDQPVVWKNRALSADDVLLLYNSGNGRAISLW